MANAFFSGDDLRRIITLLKAGTTFADVKTALGLDSTFMDNNETYLKALAYGEMARQPKGDDYKVAQWEDTVTPAPTSVTPATVDTGAPEVIHILGTGFVQGCTVTIGAHAATVLHASETVLEVQPAAHAAAADLDIVVTNPSTQAGTLSGEFHYAKKTPTFTSITPATGKAAGGYTAVIVGTNFTPGMTVTIGGHACTKIHEDATHIFIKVPAHAAGALDVVVTAVNTDAVTGTGAFTYV